MKSTDYIDWDNLKNIPFFLCQVVEDEECIFRRIPVQHFR